VLELTDLSVHYGNVAAVDGVSVTVQEGEIVAIIGPNGAGKTSTLRALSGLVRPSGGRIVFRGVDISRWRAHRIVTLGLAGRSAALSTMTVLANLRMGAYRRRDGQAIERTLAEVSSDSAAASGAASSRASARASSRCSRSTAR
jgi:branched-chain amino acid transport system ATP-binding protein